MLKQNFKRIHVCHIPIFFDDVIILGVDDSSKNLYFVLLWKIKILRIVRTKIIFFVVLESEYPKKQEEIETRFRLTK